MITINNRKDFILFTALSAFVFLVFLIYGSQCLFFFKLALLVFTDTRQPPVIIGLKVQGWQLQSLTALQ